MDWFSFSHIGRVDLNLPDEQDGRVWRHRPLGWQYPVHRHRELELNVVIRGGCSYLLEGTRYELRANTLVWLFPEQDHIQLDETPDFEMWSAVFAPRLIESCCRTPWAAPLREGNPAGTFCRTLAPPDADRLHYLFAELHQADAPADLRNAGLGFLLMSAWAAYGRSELHAPGKRLHPAVEQAARLLSDETDPMTLLQIARQVNLGSARLSYLFREQTGVSIVQFRNRRRIERFLRLCRATPDPNLLQNALDAGFGSYAQFHRVFRQVVGCAPSEWRTAHLPEEGKGKFHRTGLAYAGSGDHHSSRLPSGS